MSKLVFDGQTYTLKRNPVINVLFIPYVLITLFLYYTNYQIPYTKEITTLKQTVNPTTLQLTSGIMTFFDALLLLLILGIYFLSVYFEYDVKENKFTTYSYCIWWKYHRKIINLADYKEIIYENYRSSKKLLLEPKNETRKLYLTEVSTKDLNTEFWQSFLRDLMKAF